MTASRSESVARRPDWYHDFVGAVRGWYATQDFVPLHEPKFWGNEKQYLAQTVDSTFVSSVGEFVDRFETAIAAYTGAGYAVATVNGTAALQIALVLAGVEEDDLVITQSLTFVGTCNAIAYCGAAPVFVDIDEATRGLSPEALAAYLEGFCEKRATGCFDKQTGRRVAACVPVHVFGHPVRIDVIQEICDEYGLKLVEDAAESLGSFYRGRHTGTFGALGILSFNGNKIVTTGGGGMILTGDPALAKKAKHLTTTAKVPHRWSYDHDRIGFNYRMPNLNAALGCAQMENLDRFVESKRNLAEFYRIWFRNSPAEWLSEPPDARSNYWLQGILVRDEAERDRFLEFTNGQGIMTRPAWVPMHRLPMFDKGKRLDLPVTESIAARIVNLPSSAVRRTDAREP